METTTERILEVLSRLQPESLAAALEYARDLAQVQEVSSHD